MPRRRLFEAMDKNQPLILLAAGGTGGHLFPAEGRRTAQSGSCKAIAAGVAPADQAGFAALRLRFGRDDAPQLPAPAANLSARLPRSVSLMNPGHGRRRSRRSPWIML